MSNLVEPTNNLTLWGGAWGDRVRWGRVAFRAAAGPLFQNDDLGLRLARRVLCLRAP